MRRRTDLPAKRWPLSRLVWIIRIDIDETREKKDKMIGENSRGKGVGSSFKVWAARVYPATRVVTIGTSSLRTLRRELLCVVERIDAELKRRERGSMVRDGDARATAIES